MSVNTPQTQRRILIAVDGSDPSMWALEAGYKLAQDLNGRVLLLHVVEPLQVNEQNALDVIAAESAVRDMGKEVLKRSRAAAPSELLVETDLQYGAAAFVIAKAAANWHADYVVLGSHGRGRIAQLLIGSTAMAVIREAGCPVLAVSHQPTGLFSKASTARSAEQQCAPAATNN